MNDVVNLVEGIDTENLGVNEAEEPASYVVLEAANGARYHIIGTAHVSETSRREVAELIERIKPDVVCVELCQERYDSFKDENRWAKLDIFQVIRSGKFLYLMANLAISAYQRKMGAKLGVKPGAELIQATEVAQANGARVVLIDRNIHQTLKRVWGNLSLWTKANLFAAITASMFEGDKKSSEETAEEIEKLKENANLSTMMESFAKELPQVHLPLIDERDRYLVAKMEASGAKEAVVVVGAGHVPGMKKYFQTPIDTQALEQLPKPGLIWPMIKWVFPVLLLSTFAYAAFNSEFASLESLLIAWILPNSIFCALACIVAGAKPLTTLSSIFISPITSTTPVIGAGIVLGLLEAWLRKPNVEDCESVPDVHSLKDFYKNPVTRILLVAVLSTFGSALGAWIGIGWIVTLLGLGTGA